MKNVQVETDCQNLVQALKGNEYDLAPEGTIFKEIKIYTRQNFNNFSFTFAPRGCNKLAHTIAAVGARGPAAR